MKTISAVIIDDETSSRDTLRSILKEFFPFVKIVGEAHSPSTAIALLEKTPTQLCFLDVEMQHGTGFDVLEGLKKIDFQVIFVTAHKEEAYRSFRFDALDYLIKPIRISELRSAIEKFQATDARVPQPDIRNTIRNPHQDQQILVPDLNGYLVVEVSEIIRCESSRNYTNIYLKSGKKILATKPLKEFEDLLANVGFVRIHRSHVVCIAMIAKIIRGRNAEIIMKDETLIPVSRERRAEFFRQFLNPTIEAEFDEE
ncbi:MAG: response regulator transcription factor [Flavobacteriales bacterium]|jgi:two-component system LytT family response regulator|nr:response regulator transcription factor [Flavobacteriales bacterium]